MKVLDINNGISIADKAFEGAEITPLTLAEFAEREITEQYDLVFCFHTLQMAWREEVIPLVKKMAACVKHVGELWIIVPSFEWAVEEGRKDESSPALQMVLYGDHQTPYHSCYKLSWMRVLVESTGLITRQATQGMFEVLVNDEPVKILQNKIVAMKYQPEEEVVQ